MNIMTIIGLISLSLAFQSHANSQEDESDTVQINPIQIVEPDEEIREEYEAQIDTEFFEIGAYIGIISVEDFNSESIFGIKASFHATEDFFLQANMVQTELGISAAEEKDDSNLIVNRDYNYYNLLVGYNLFPGESFINQNLTLNSTFYLVAGIGNTELNTDNHFTITYGSGYRILLNDWMTWNIDFRNHTFESKVLASSKQVNNLEFSVGMTVFF